MFAAVILTIVYFSYLTMLFKQLTFSYAFLGALELTPLLFNIWNAIRQSLFSIHILFLFTLAAKGHITELNALLQSFLLKFKINNKHQQPFRSLDFFYCEYWRMLALARLMNSQVVSGLMFFIFTSNLALNLVMISSLLFRALYNSEKVIMLFFINLQSLLIVLCSFSLSAWSSCFCRSDGLLYSVQLRLMFNLNNRTLITAAKLKLNTFFEQVCTKEEFRFSVGALGKISSKSLYEFALLYSCLVMYVAKMVSRGRLL